MKILTINKQKVTAKQTKEIQVTPPTNKVTLLDEKQLQENVRRKAYELYMQRGAIEGHEVEDWVEAEQFVLQNIHYIKCS